MIKRIFLVLFLVIFTMQVDRYLFAAAKDELASADALYEERNDLGKARQAMILYENLGQKHPNSYDVWWKLARARYWVATYDKSLKEMNRASMYEEAINFAKYSIQLKEDNAAAHYWLGINLGKFGQIKGMFKAMSLLPDLREAMRRVIELDPSYEGGGAHLVLGKILYRLPSFGKKNILESIGHLEKAAGYDPTNLATHLALGESYYKNGEYEKAKVQFQAVVQLPPTKFQVLSAAETKRDAQRWLNTMME